MSVKSVLGSSDPDIAAATRISPATWFLIVVLIATITGWGVSTLANTSELEKHEARLEQKADKEDVDRGFEQVMERLKEIQQDVRDIRRQQQRSSTGRGE